MQLQNSHSFIHSQMCHAASSSIQSIPSTSVVSSKYSSMHSLPCIHILTSSTGNSFYWVIVHSIIPSCIHPSKVFTVCVCVFGGRLRAWPELIKAGCDMRNTLRPTFHSHFDASDRVMFTQQTALSHIPTRLSSHGQSLHTRTHTHPPLYFTCSSTFLV